MIIHTNENNTSSLKLIIASKIAKKSVEVRLTSVSDPSLAAPHLLPVLEVNEDLKFFSSNAALLYLLPNSKSIDGLVIKELLEWEATRLLPIIITVLSSKSVAPDIKQTLVSYLSDLDKRIFTEHYLLASELSAADISIWCSLFPLLSQSSFKDYTSGLNKLNDWFSRVQGLTSVQESIRSWSKGNNDDYLKGSAILASSKLGLPLSTLAVAGSPDEAAVTGPTGEEISLAEDRWLNGHKILPKLPPKQKVVLPQKGFKNVLITSALPYVNNIPHLGNIIGCVLSADIFARYCRMCGYNTLYICGTDEYGTATETKALEEGLTPRQICDKYFEIHNAVYRWFGIGFDYFGRTTTPEQTEIVQKMFLKLKDNGFMNTESVEQLLCAKCDRFLADRFVEGTCPHPGCGYEDARGDQCDACGKLVTATDLIKPRCKICSTTPQVTQSKQFFLDLPQLEGALRSWFSKTESGWSGTSRAVTKAWLRDGLKPRCITRDLKWGIPVPIEEFKSKVFYVWFDAPIGYMSITQKYTNDHEKWWKPDAEHEVKLYQFMAKDNVPFHGIMFPATLIGVNEKHILVNHIMATEYLNYEEGKFSKSRGVGVFGTDAQETGIPADVWRFYLASIRPEGQDSSFSWNELVTRNNSELLNNLGNFCHRGLSFCASSFKGIVPELNLNATDLELIALINREIKSYVKGMEAGRLRDALRHVLSVSRLGNQYMQSEQPWVLLKGSDQDKLRAGNAVAMCCNVSALLAALLSPFMPATSRRLFQQIAATEEHCRVDPEHPEMRILLPSGHRIGKPEPLFEKLDPNTIEQLKAKYAGTQDQRAQKKGSSESQVNTNTSQLTVAELEEAVTKQGEKVRALKQSGAEKAVWQPEVNILLDLKKKLASALKTPPTSSNSVQTTANSTANTGDVKQLEEEIAKQGEKVRALKQSGVEKAVWQPEVNILLDLKKKLASAPKTLQASSNSVQTMANFTANTGDVKQIEEEIAKQGEKVRSLKTSGAEKSLWQPEVNLLLELKKKLVLAGGEVAAPPKPGKQKKK